MNHIDVNHAIMAIVFILAAIIKLRQKQMEHFFTRFAAAVWYTLTVIDPNMDVDAVRIISTFGIIIIFTIEITSPIVRKYYGGKGK